MDPNVGRFVTMDEFAGSGRDPYSLHKYLYAHANPVNNTDPSGYITVQEFAMTGLMVGILAGIQSDSLLLSESEPMGPVNPTEMSPTRRVKLAMAAMNHGAETTFIARASQVATEEPLKPNDGKDFLLLLSQNSSPSEQIRELFVFSHAISRGILMQNDQGFYVDTGLWGKVKAYFGFTNRRDIDDLIKLIKKGDIVFSEDAIIKLFGCNLATGEFAQKLSNITGATVIASEGRVSSINGTNSAGKPYETGWFQSDDAWYEHTPNQSRKKLGKKIRAW